MYDFYAPYWHPIAVHFSVALPSVAAFLYLFSLIRGGGAARIAADWTFGLGLLAAVFTVGFGFLAYYTVTHDAPSHAAMTEHRNWALATAAVFLALGAWRWLGRSAGKLFVIGMIAGTVLLGVTGFKGGHLVYEYGLAVQSLPDAHGGAGHDHDHGGTGEDAVPEGAEAAGEDAHAHPEEADHHGHSDGGSGEAAPGTPEAVSNSLQAFAQQDDQRADEHHRR